MPITYDGGSSGTSTRTTTPTPTPLELRRARRKRRRLAAAARLRSEAAARRAAEQQRQARLAAARRKAAIAAQTKAREDARRAAVEAARKQAAAAAAKRAAQIAAQTKAREDARRLAVAAAKRQAVALAAQRRAAAAAAGARKVREEQAALAAARRAAAVAAQRKAAIAAQTKAREDARRAAVEKYRKQVGMAPSVKPPTTFTTARQVYDAVTRINGSVLDRIADPERAFQLVFERKPVGAEKALYKKARLQATKPKSAGEHVTALGRVLLDAKGQGGRIDKDAVESIDQSFADHVLDVTKRTEAMVRERDKYLPRAEQGDRAAIRKLRELQDSPEYKELLRDHASLYGAGPGDSGLFDLYYRERNRLQTESDRYWARVLRVKQERWEESLPPEVRDLRKRYPEKSMQQIVDMLESQERARMQRGYNVRRALYAADAIGNRAAAAHNRQVYGEAPKYIRRVLGMSDDGDLSSSKHSLGDERVARQVIDRALEVWKTDWGTKNGVDVASFGTLVRGLSTDQLVERRREMDRYRAEREAFRNQLYQTIQGRDAPGVVEEMLGSVLQMPHVQTGLELLTMPFGLPAAALKQGVRDFGLHGRERVGGELTSAHINLEAFGQDYVKLRAALPSYVRDRFGTGNKVGRHSVDWDMQAWRAWQATREGRAWLERNPAFRPLIERAPGLDILGGDFLGKNLLDLTAATVRGDAQEYRRLFGGRAALSYGGMLGIDATPEARRRVADDREALALQVQAARENPDPVASFWGQVSAAAMWGSETFSSRHGAVGNLTANIALDPLNKFTLSPLWRGAQLAMARQAGKGLKGVPGFARDYAGLLRQYGGGLRRPADDPIREYLELRPLSRTVGRPLQRYSDVGPADLEAGLRDLFEKNLVDPNLKNIKGGLERMFRGTPIESKQIQVAAERLLDEVIVARGTKALRSGDLQKLRHDAAKVADEEPLRRARAEAPATRKTEAQQRRAAARARQRRLDEQGETRGRFERSDDFEDPPRTPVKGNPMRPGDFRAPKPQRLRGGMFEKRYGKKLSERGRYTVSVPAEGRHTQDIIAIADDIARRHHIGLRWARSPAELANRGARAVELFGGSNEAMVRAGRELDEALSTHRLGRRPVRAGNEAVFGRVGVRLDSGSGPVPVDNPFAKYERLGRTIEGGQARVDRLGDEIASVRNDLEAALVKAREPGASTLEASRLTKRLDELVTEHRRLAQGLEGARSEQARLVAMKPAKASDSVAERALADLLNSELRRDSIFLRSERNKLVRQLRGQLSDAQRTALDRRVAQLDEAIAGVELSKADVLGQPHVARRVADRYGDEAARFVRPQSIAPLHENADSLRVFQSQDLHAQWDRGGGRQPAVAPPPPEGNLDRAAEYLERRPLIRAAAAAELGPQRTALLRRLSARSQIEALAVLAEQVPNGAVASEWRRRLNELRQAADFTPAQLVRYGDDGEMMGWLSQVHRQPWISFDEYREIDAMVAKAVRDVRGYKAAGQFTGPAPQWMRELATDMADDMPSPRVLTDYDVEIRLAKIEALDGSPVDTAAYDELRGVFRGHLVREKRAKAIAEEAARRSEADGRPYSEHFLEVREEAARFEARLQLRRFVLRSESGMREEDYWADFLRAQDEDQLRPPPATTLTPFQQFSLEHTLVRRLGVKNLSRDDQVRAALRGQRMPADADDMELLQMGLPGVPGDIPVYRSKVPMTSSSGRNLLGYFRPHFGLVIGPDDVKHKTLWHEYAHAMAIYAEREGLPVWHELEAVVAANRMELDRAFHLTTRGYSPGEIAHEAVAEAYAAWRRTRHLVQNGAERSELLEEYTWDWLARHSGMSSADITKLNRLFERLEPPPASYFGVNLDVAPPFSSRAEAREWLVEKGFWSPALGEDILAGRRVWSLADEADFWRSRYGDVPPWADEAAYGEDVLHQQFIYKEKMLEWGFMDRKIERAAATSGVDLQRALAWGDEAAGVEPGRTIEDLRDWFRQRYGALVYDEAAGEFTALPWLMDPNSTEYANYIARRGKEFLGKDLVTAEQAPALAKAMQNAVAKRVKRLEEAGELADDAHFLPQERLRLVLDVVDELLDNPSWRPWFTFRGLRPSFERKSLVAQGLTAIGTVNRLNVFTNPAFPVLNVFENTRLVGPKRLLQAIAHPELIGQGVTKRSVEAVPDLRSMAFGRSTTMWHRVGRSSLERLRDADPIFEAAGMGEAFRRAARKGRLVAGAAYEAPMGISAWAEDANKLRFARRMWQERYDHYLGRGMSDMEAETLARLVTAERVRHLFPTLENAPYWLHALNDLIPFLSYNWKTSTLYAGELLTHPQFIRYFGMLGDMLEESNRSAWEAENPGLPFPSDHQARHFVFQVGDKTYTIDFANMSDVTRGWKVIPFLTGGDQRTLREVITRFIRVPHPWQAAVIAHMTGGTEPWSKDKATLGSWVWPVDVWEMIGKMHEDGVLDDGELFQLFTKLALFSEAKELDVMKSLNAAFWALPEGRARREFVDAHPELLEYWKASSDEPWKVRLGEVPEPHWFQASSEAKIKALRDARAGLAQIRAAYDEGLADLLREGVLPNDPRYKELKAERRAAILQYRRDHPELIDIELFYMTGKEYAEQQDEWEVDRLIEKFFAMQPPTRGEKQSEAAWRAELERYYDAREAWLEAHPQVMAALRNSDDPLRNAIWDHQDHIFEIRDQIADRSKLLAQARDADDYDLADVLDFANDLDYMRIDTPSQHEYYPPPFDGSGLIAAGGPKGLLFDYARERLSVFGVLPGATDAKYAKATPAEQIKMEVDYLYAKNLDEVMRVAGDSDQPGAAFYEELEKKPWLLAEYFERNPEKKVSYERNQRYIGLIERARKRDDWDGFFREIAGDAEMIRRWLMGSKNFSGNIDATTWGRIEAAFAKVRRTGNSDAIFRLIDRDPAVRALYFAGGKDRRANYTKNQAYITRMGDLIARSKASGDWSIFWNAIENDKALRERWFAGKPGRRQRYQQNQWYMGRMGSIMGKVKKTGNWDHFWNAIDGDKRLRERWFAGEAGRREKYFANKRYISFMGELVGRAKRKGDWSIFWKGLEANPEMMRRYMAGKPGRAQTFRQNRQYVAAMKGWVDLLSKKRFDEARRYYDGLPSWVRRRYEKAHPQSARTAAYVASMKKWVGFFERKDFDGGMKYFNALPNWMREKYFAKHPEKRQKFAQNGAYMKAMGTWVGLLDKKRYDEASRYFDGLPGWVKERYFKNNPGKRKRFAQNDEYVAAMGKWVSFFERDDAEGGMRYFNNLPTWVRERYFKNNPGKRQEFAQNEEYVRAMGKWVSFFERDDAEGGMKFFDKLPSWVRERYFKNNPGKRKEFAQNEEYVRSMSKWVSLFEAGKPEAAMKYFDSLPQAIRERYFKNNPGKREQFAGNSAYAKAMGEWVDLFEAGKPQAAMKYFDSLPKAIRERYFKNNPGKREQFAGNSAYAKAMGKWVDLFEAGKPEAAMDYFDSLPKAIRERYFKNNPGKREQFAQNDAYLAAMGKWTSLFEKGDSAGAMKYFDGLPAWIRQRYFKNNPGKREQFAQNDEYIAAMGKWTALFEKGDSSGAMKFFDSLPAWMRQRYFKNNPGKKEDFAQNNAYMNAMGKWVALIEQDDSAGARAFFDGLPGWMKERYYKAHPERRDFTASAGMFAKLSEMFHLPLEEQADYLAANKDLRAWMGSMSGGKEEVRRAMVLQVYRQIPREDRWLKRVFQARYPEVFSREASSERRDERTAAELSRNPDVKEGYDRYLRQIIGTYLGSVRGSSAPPRQLDKVQRATWEKTRRRRLRGRREWELQKPPGAIPGMANVQQALAEIGGR